MKFRRGTKAIHILLTLVVAFGFLFVHIARAVTAEPGTPEDPIVSQSYVDSKVAAITNELNSLKQQIPNLETSPLNSKVSAIESELTTLKQQVQNGQLEQGGKFEVIGPLPLGKQLIAGESTEVVLRGGSATAIASDKGGVVDLITGIDIGTGENVPLNHLLLIPRNDGRGLTITRTDTWIMVRGSYTIR